MEKKLRKMKIKELNRMALGAAFIAVCGWINIPGPVPYTMQTFALCMASGLLGSKKATFSVVIYILMGVIGLPVFSGGRSGIGIILGETGGYIMGFLPMVWFFGKAYRQKEKSIAAYILVMLWGLFLCYVCGTLWAVLVYIKNGNIVAGYVVLAKYVLPFIIPDLIKIFLADITVNGLKKRGI